MADVSKIKLGSTTYNIKDSSAVHGTVTKGDSVTVTKGDSVIEGTPFTVPNVTSVGSAPTLGTAIPADDITAWSAGTLPTLGTAIPADDITGWTANTPTAVTPNTVVSGVNAVQITYDSTNERVIFPEYVLNGGEGQVTNGASATVTAGTAASLSYSAKSIPNVTAVGTLPSLSYTAKSIPNITSVGSTPTLGTAFTIPNISKKQVVTDVTKKTVVTGIS